MKKITTKISILVVLSLFLAAALPYAALARSFDTIIAFGDSLTDHGGLQSYLGAYDPVNNPEGAPETWTNGDVWVDYLADDLSATLYNNAIGGAMTVGHINDTIQGKTDDGTLPPLGLVGQVNRFDSEDVNFSAASTLFTIWIGGNDLLKFGRGESDAATSEDLITDAVDNVLNAMSELVTEEDALNIMVINLPDLGKTPAYNSLTTEEIQAVTDLTSAFNSALAQGINNFSSLFPDVTVISFDVFTYLNQIISGDTFADVTGTYMVLDENGNPTGATNEPAEDYLFWDAIHPTTKAHEMVAEEVAKTLDDTEEDDGTISDPEEDNDDNGDSSSGCFIGTLK